MQVTYQWKLEAMTSADSIGTTSSQKKERLL
jgi:hypothetical protein